VWRAARPPFVGDDLKTAQKEHGSLAGDRIAISQNRQIGR
jgi:hypothetical protein